MTTEKPANLDLDAYLGRINYQGRREPSMAVLEAVHLAHATHIPYENLDILLGRPIRLDLPSIEAKLVRGGRGGYCFEQNKLLAVALTALGFSVELLAARVRYRYRSMLPRTHMVLLVAAEGEQFLADVGFGALGLLLPVSFVAGAESHQYTWTFRLNKEPGLWVMQSRRENTWEDLYAFSLDPQQMIDYEMANYYTSTHPDSRFVHTPTAQRMTTETRHILRNRELITDSGKVVTTREVKDEELLALLAETFGLDFPEGTVFSSPVSR